jgi:thiol-activated cytolysin
MFARLAAPALSLLLATSALAACGGADLAPADLDQEGPVDPNTPGGDPTDPSKPADRTKALEALIGSGGKIDTTKSADQAPVEKGRQPDLVTKSTDGTELRCTQTDYSLTKVPERFVALNPNADVLWPGSLVQGKSMASGILDPIPVDRAPGAITLTIASGGGGPFFRELPRPSLSSATQAVNDILSTYGGKTPAKFSYSFSSIHSMEQLGVAVDANVKGTNWSAAAALSFDKSDSKSRMLIQFTQEYYTMAYDPPKGAAGVFGEGVTDKDLAPYVGAGNPPVYVASVTYGRIFYLLFESTASQTELEAAVKGSYSGGAISADASVSARWKQTVDQSTVRAYGLGGNAQSAIAAATGWDVSAGTGAVSQHDAIKKFLTEGATFDKDNPGVPISYTIRYLADGSQVRLALTTEYTAKNCVPVQRGCDGVEGSTKVADACGVCGGDGSTCRPCGAWTYKKKMGNDAYAIFAVPATAHGGQKGFADGYHTEYRFPSCRGIGWRGVTFTCNAGSWSLDRNASFWSDALCHGNSNDKQEGLSVGVE